MLASDAGYVNVTANTTAEHLARLVGIRVRDDLIETTTKLAQDRLLDALLNIAIAEAV